MSERSHGKLRPSLPRLGEVGAVVTVRDRSRNHGAGGRFPKGNDAAKGKGWKASIRKMLGEDATDAVALAVAADAWRIFSANLREMPNDGSMVRGLLMRKARHEALSAFWEAQATAAGLATEAGVKAQENATKHGQRSERLAVTALDMAVKLAAATRDDMDPHAALEAAFAAERKAK